MIGYAWSVDCGMEFSGWVKRVVESRGKRGDLSDEFTGLLLDENGLCENESALVTTHIEGDCWAIGSGAQAALGAIPMGADPEEAVQFACAIVSYCSGPTTGGTLTGRWRDRRSSPPRLKRGWFMRSP